MADAGDHKNVFIQVWRGIAVLLVVSYHFTNRVPYQALDASTPPSLIFYSGKLGVLIFFAISGYLIAQSLAVSDNLASFYAKRLSRLWPLFLLATVTVYVAMMFLQPPVVTQGPGQFLNHRASLVDMIGSLFFLEDFGFAWVDGVFWSILVELKFYFIIGLLAWLSPKRYVAVFAIIALLAGGAELLCRLSGIRDLMRFAPLLNGVLIAQHAPFFAVGALLSQRGSRDLLTLNILLAACEMGFKIAENPDFNLHGTLIYMMVLMTIVGIDAALFDRRIFRTIGDYSYSWYLFHQLIGLSLIRLFAARIGMDASVLLALASTFLICVAGSWLAEWRFRRSFYVVIDGLLSRLGLDRAKVGAAASRPGDDISAAAAAGHGQAT